MIEPGQVKRFIAAVEAAIKECDEAVVENRTFREVHDELRDLYRPCTDLDLSIGRVRARIETLSPAAMREIERVAPRALAGLRTPWAAVARRGKNTDPMQSEEPTVEDCGFRAWARIADGEELIRALQVIVASGAMIVPGRNRRTGKRSRPRIELRIMGHVRGGFSRKNKGGRPTEIESSLRLIGRLAQSWQKATGAFPEAGRSDRTPFGELVYFVFDWVGAGSPEHALRQWWSEIRRVESLSTNRPRLELTEPLQVHW